jgi:hypothetical protein
VARLRQQLRDGADGVKIFAGAILPGRVLPMPLDIAKALVAEAHRAGKPAFAHPSNLEGIEIALQSGVDILAHTAGMSGPWAAFPDRKDARGEGCADSDAHAIRRGNEKGEGLASGCPVRGEHGRELTGGIQQGRW